MLTSDKDGGMLSRKRAYFVTLMPVAMRYSTVPKLRLTCCSVWNKDVFLWQLSQNRRAPVAQS